MDKDNQNLSPMMRQYLMLKEKYPGTVLFFRLGDFYEMFFEDAVKISAELDLTLTGRDCGLSERAPMCGVPYHAVDTYLKRLIDKGYKVAVCEQLTEPNGKGMVERDVVRVVTPGTAIDDGLLDEKKNNYIASVYMEEGAFGIAWADISTGEFNTAELSGEKAAAELADLLTAAAPSEIISNEAFIMASAALECFSLERLTEPARYHAWAFQFENAQNRLFNQLNTKTLSPFIPDDKRLAVIAAGALAEYFLETQKRSLSHINKIKFISENEYMPLDANTRRNLELFESLRDRKKQFSLLGIIDKTRTNPGARCIRRWLDRPLQSADLINERLNAVEELVKNIAVREEMAEILPSVRDLERFAGKISYGSINPRDCLGIAASLAAVFKLKKPLKRLSAPLFKKLDSKMNECAEIRGYLLTTIDENAPALLKDGGFIKKGFSTQLDQYKSARADGKLWLANLEANEREETGIKSLKVGYNQVFGYYIEVSKSYIDKVPYRYQRKQTLAGGERYITEELKQIEEKILGAEDAAIRLELQLFAEIKEKLAGYIETFQADSEAVGIIDTLTAFAEVAVKNKYVKPVLTKKQKNIVIVEGRHPIVEAAKNISDFVPNDTDLNDDSRTMVITGPNMAGKSTYMRQVALIALMAHIGCFVPASRAEIPIIDRIFTRIGASDDVTGGQSTFMVEMIEVASILNNATERSLLILDEIGRGTSTLDGISIAWAVLEYISLNLKSKTLFATHFHELTELEGILKSVKNFRILVKEYGNSIIFLHKIARGGSNKSFGIEVSELAGVPASVVTRAKELMRLLESKYLVRDANEIMLKSLGAANSKQIGFFDETENEVEAAIKELDLDNMTPMQALAVLTDLKKRVLSRKS
jgi:DNA mismatch repair protein MutS